MITDGDLLALVAAGGDPALEWVADHVSPTMTFAAPDWSLKQAAEGMPTGDFQHVVVVEPAGIVGIIAMATSFAAG